MTDFEVVRVVGEVVGVGAAVGTGFWYIARQVWRVLEETRRVNSRLDQLNGSVATHTALLNNHELVLAKLQGKEEARQEMASAASAAVSMLHTEGERQ